MFIQRSPIIKPKAFRCSARSMDRGGADSAALEIRPFFRHGAVKKLRILRSAREGGGWNPGPVTTETFCLRDSHHLNQRKRVRPEELERAGGRGSGAGQCLMYERAAPFRFPATRVSNCVEQFAVGERRKVSRAPAARPHPRPEGLWRRPRSQFITLLN